MKSMHIFTRRAQSLLLAVIFGLLPCKNVDAQYGSDIAPKVDFDKKLLTPDGNFTEESLPKFLTEAYREKKLKDDTFSKEACLKAKDIGSQGGMQTSQLFLVTSLCQPTQAAMYIIKESTSGLHELEHLQAIEKFPGMKELVAPNVVAGLPSIALPFAYFSYANGGMHYIAAMPAAKGKPLTAVMIDFRDNPSPQNTERLGRAFRILGKELSAFHKRFMKPEEGRILGNTIIHGDFHPFNIFYDEIAGHFTFIDAESMSRSLHHPTNPVADILELFVVPFTINKNEFQNFRDLIKGVDLKTWWNVTLKNFLLGYIEPYAPTQRKQVLQEMKKMFNDDFKIFGWAEFNDAQIKNIQNAVINPIFEEL